MDERGDLFRRRARSAASPTRAADAARPAGGTSHDQRHATHLVTGPGRWHGNPARQLPATARVRPRPGGRTIRADDRAAALHLHPDRLLPGRPDDPRDRPPALRAGAGPADHLPARPRAAGVDRRRRPVRRPDVPADLPGPLRHAAAARARGAAGSTRRRRHPARRRTAPGRPGGRCATHWVAFRGTPSRFWLESELGEIFGVTVRPSAATADAIYDQIAEILQRPDFRPAGAAAALRHRGAGHHRRPLRRPGPPRRDPRRRRRCATRVLPTFRPDRYLEPAAPGLAGARRRAGRRRGHRHRRLQGLHRRAGGAAPLLHRARRGLGRPQPRRRRHRAARPGRRRADLHRRPRRHARRRRRPPRCAGTCCWRWRGCRSRTGW